jgi:hypothetical protein
MIITKTLCCNRVVWGIIEEDIENLIEDVNILINDND